MKTINSLLAVLLSLALVSCATVTESGSRLERKKSPEKAVENYTQLGVGYLQSGHPERARNRLQHALAINENYAPANDAMGMVWQTEGEFDLAEEFYKKALKNDKKYTPARHHLGRLYFQLNQQEKALKELQIATDDRYYDSRPEAFNDTALLYHRQDKPELAIQAYTQTLRLAPYNVEALVNVSTLYFEAQDFNNSAKYFDRLDRLAKDGRVAHTAHSLWLGIQLSTLQNNPQRALALASELKLNFPQSEQYQQYVQSLSGAR